MLIRVNLMSRNNCRGLCLKGHALLIPDFLLLIISEHLFAYLVNLMFTNKIYYRFGELNECGIGHDNLIFPIIAARHNMCSNVINFF